MKRLLLLFVISPVILFGQNRRKEVVDSIKTATVAYLQGIAGLLGNIPGNQVEHIAVIDSAGYFNITFRTHTDQMANLTAISPQPIVIQMPALVGVHVPKLPLPRLPPIVLNRDTISAISFRPIINIKSSGSTAVVTHHLKLPPLPPVVLNRDTVTTAPFRSFETFQTHEFAATNILLTNIPRLPPVVLDRDTITAVLTFVFHVSVPNTTSVKIEYIPLTSLPKIRIDTAVEKPIAEMHLSDDGYSLLEKMEGFAPEEYSLRDGGFTIGFGFFFPYGQGTRWEKGMSRKEAEIMIRKKVPLFENQVKKYINVPLQQTEFDALTMLAYNLGGFSKATSIVDDVNSQADPDILQTDWNKFVHSKAPSVKKGLINRRKDELGVKENANYQPERKIPILKSR